MTLTVLCEMQCMCFAYTHLATYVHVLSIYMAMQLCTKLHSELRVMYFLLIEFCANGNWHNDAPVHPRLSLYESKAINYHFNMCNLHTTSKLHALYTSLYVCIIIII